MTIEVSSRCHLFVLDHSSNISSYWPKGVFKNNICNQALLYYRIKPTDANHTGNWRAVQLVILEKHLAFTKKAYGINGSRDAEEFYLIRNISIQNVTPNALYEFYLNMDYYSMVKLNSSVLVVESLPPESNF